MLAFLQRPFRSDEALYGPVHRYWIVATAVNEVAESIGVPVSAGTYRQDRAAGLVELVSQLSALGDEIEARFVAVLQTLSPLSGI